MRYYFPHASFPNRTDRAGFTLVEMVVSLAIFSIVAVVALGALVKIIDTNKKAQTLQSSITNLNFALESMSREMRVGTSYYCQMTGNYATLNPYIPYNGSSPMPSQDCADGIGSGVTAGSDRLIAFYSSKFDPAIKPPATPCPLITVYLITSAYPKPDGTGNQWMLEKAQQQKCSDRFVAGMFQPVISPDITITDFRMGVTPTSQSAPYPKAFVRLSGYAGEREKERTYFDVQTAISSRLLQ